VYCAQYVPLYSTTEGTTCSLHSPYHALTHSCTILTMPLLLTMTLSLTWLCSPGHCLLSTGLLTMALCLLTRHYFTVYYLRRSYAVPWLVGFHKAGSLIRQVPASPYCHPHAFTAFKTTHVLCRIYSPTKLTQPDRYLRSHICSPLGLTHAAQFTHMHPYTHPEPSYLDYSSVLTLPLSHYL
jgi:hypothetical protein